MINFEKHILPNGLIVIAHRDTTTPFAALNLVYNVGSKDEAPHRTGFAHLFEHLMFGGSVNVPDFDTPLQQAGGNNNAFTSVDITNYYITVPVNNLETAFWLESDRMFGLNFCEEGLELQKKVVIEEFHQRYLNQPYGDVWHLLRDLSYKTHPYRWPTIGLTPDHVKEANLEEVKDFFYHHYAPNNAVLAITGNIDIDAAFKLTEKWFGSIPRRELIPRNLPSEKKQTEDRELTVSRNVPLNSVYCGWHMGARGADDFFAVDLLSDVLANGQSSRLQQRLVRDKQLFVEVDAYLTGENEPGLFIGTGKINPGIDPEVAKKALLDEIYLTTNELISDYELEKVKNKAEANLLYSEIGFLEKAMQLSAFEILGDAAQINEQVNHYRQISREDIRRVAEDIFRPGNKNTLNYSAKNK